MLAPNLECCDCEAKFSLLNDVEELDPASVLVGNDQKTISGPSLVEIVFSQSQGFQLLLIEQVQRGSRSILEVTFFDTLYVDAKRGLKQKQDDDDEEEDEDDDIVQV